MQELINFLREKGFDFEPELTEQNKFQSFKTPTRKGWFTGSVYKSKSGKEIIVASVGDWRTGEKYHFRSSDTLDASEEREVTKRISAQKKAEADAREAARGNAAEAAQEEWSAIVDSGIKSPYLTKKKIPQTFGAKTVKSSYGTIELIIPMRDVAGKLWGYQRIQEDSGKFFLPGQRTEGLFHLIGQVNPEDTLYIAEGFATGATIHLATGRAVACAFFGNNLLSVARALREKYRDTTIVFCGDDDRFSDAGNAGKEKALEAAQEISATCVFPEFKSYEGKPTDFNDLLVEEGIEQVRSQIKQHVAIAPSLFIKTENTGFHSEKLVRGSLILTPEYEDLRRFFERTHKYRVMSQGGICHSWNGKFYEVLDKKTIENFAHLHFRPVADNKKIAEFVGLVLRSNVVPYSWFDHDTSRKINFQNGYLNLDTNEFLPHTPDIGFRHVLDYAYDQEAKCPAFDGMLDSVSRNDRELQQTILEFAGYSISQDSCWAQKALVLEGSGSNGKSTLMSVLRALAGHANCMSLTLADLKGEYNRQMLDGKLLNIAEETPSKALSDSSIFKNLVSGGETLVRKIYGDPYTMRNRAKIIFSCNELPVSQDTTDAFFRRMLIIPFRAKYEPGTPGFDPFMEQKCLAELPGIFNRVLKAYRELWDRKMFTESAASRAALEAFKRDANPIKDWIDDKVKIYETGNGHDNMLVTIAQMYDEYSADMDRQGFRPCNMKSFVHQLRAHLPNFEERKDRKKVDGREQQVFKAVQLYSVKAH